MAKLISKKKKTDRELCQIIATSVTEIVRDSLNPTFRQTYFDTLQVSTTGVVLIYIIFIGYMAI